MLVNNAVLKGAKGGHLAICDGGEGATKAEIVSVWKRLRSRSVTGHSTRRSGALQYIRKGWAINVSLEYAQEALESMAVNASNFQ